MLRSGRLLLTAWMAATACTRWTPYVASGADGATPLRIARITLRDGTSHMLENVVVRPDSVVGLEQTRDRLRIAYASQQVQRVERTEFSAPRTVAFVVIFPAVVIGLAFAAWVLTCDNIFEC